jgi:exosortase
MNLQSLRNSRWNTWHGLAAAVMAMLGIAATFPVWDDIGDIAWNDEEYSHILLVPLVAVWMVWVRRMRFRYCRATGTGLGVLMASVGWAVSSYGFHEGHQSLWHGGAVLVVIGCVLSVLGKQALFQFLPAVAVLVFVVPVPGMIRQQIAIPLQTWTAQITEVILEVAGIPVDRSVNWLTVNGKPLEIAEACNGLRMVWPLILMSYAFSFGLPLRNSVRFVLLLASPLSAIFCNVVRILPTVWVYSRYDDDVGLKFHDVSGWLMLPIAFLLLLGIIKMLDWALVPVRRYTLAS